MGIILGLNKDVVERIVKTAGMQTLIDGSPRDIIEIIDPVLVCNPERIVSVVQRVHFQIAIEEPPVGDE